MNGAYTKLLSLTLENNTTQDNSMDVYLLETDFRNVLLFWAHSPTTDRTELTRNPHMNRFKSLDRNVSISLPELNQCGLSSIDQALEKLNKMSATAKRSLIDACARTIDHDGKSTDIEIQILRGIACALSCPLGPNL